MRGMHEGGCRRVSAASKVVEAIPAVAACGHELAVMRDDQDASARACRRGKLMRDDFHVRAVEPARRLVEDEHVAIRKQDAGDGEQRCRRPPSSIERISSGVNSARMRPFSR